MRKDAFFKVIREKQSVPTYMMTSEREYWAIEEYGKGFYGLYSREQCEKLKFYL